MCLVTTASRQDMTGVTGYKVLRRGTRGSYDGLYRQDPYEPELGALHIADKEPYIDGHTDGLGDTVNHGIHTYGSRSGVVGCYIESSQYAVFEVELLGMGYQGWFGQLVAEAIVFTTGEPLEERPL